MLWWSSRRSDGLQGPRERHLMIKHMITMHTVSQDDVRPVQEAGGTPTAAPGGHVKKNTGFIYEKYHQKNYKVCQII